MPPKRSSVSSKGKRTSGEKHHTASGHEYTDKIKKRFQKLDKNYDGKLSLEELSVLLVKGNPNMTEREIERLFEKVDKDGAGFVEFDEFVEFIYSDDYGSKSAEKRTSVRLEKSLSSEQHDVLEDEGIAWEAVKDTFYQYSGPNESLESYEFFKMCRDCGLIGLPNFGRGDLDVVFKAVLRHGHTHMYKREFMQALHKIADRTEEPVTYIRGKICGLDADTHDNEASVKARISGMSM